MNLERWYRKIAGLFKEVDKNRLINYANPEIVMVIRNTYISLTIPRIENVAPTSNLRIMYNIEDITNEDSESNERKMDTIWDDMFNHIVEYARIKRLKEYEEV